MACSIFQKNEFLSAGIYLKSMRGISPQRLFDHWNQVRYEVGTDQEYLSGLIHIRFVLWRQNSLIYRL